ncbi:MAG TPA: universal stress protein [Gaiellales bacterium]|jgi:nucleotide-binding universal stress UspA family protein|nr:universal stress protein [Gaiellales bacterium]
MYRTIVIALDGSEGSDRALPVAAEYARRDGARVVVAHQRIHAIETAIEEKIHSQVEEFAATGLDASVTIRDSLVGREADVIADVAKADADLIVIAPGAGARSPAPSSGASPSACCRSHPAP